MILWFKVLEDDMIINCPVCGKEVEAKAYRETYVSDWNKKEYKLYHCPSCDLQWWEPLKIEPEFYEEEGGEAYAVFHLLFLRFGEKYVF